MEGYIYLRDYKYYYFNDIKLYKLGFTKNIIERNNTYISGEIDNSGKFVLIIKIENVKVIEKNLKHYFKYLNVYNGAGTEFYNSIILELLESHLKYLGYKYEIINSIDELSRNKRANKIYKKLDIIIPRNDQIKIINKSLRYFENNTKGLLCLCCGIGKSYISLFIAQTLQFKNILIGVPNLLLLNQWKYFIKNILTDYKIFKIYSNISKDNIDKILRRKCKKVIITTYSSSYKLLKDFKFDIKILDEAHHLSIIDDNNSNRTYNKILKIKSDLQLSLTATMKISDNNKIITNDNVEYFGNVISHKTMSWGIKNKIICDYVIHTLVYNNFDFDDNLYLAAYSALKSLISGDTHHLLIYCNTRENSYKIVEYIKMLLDDNNIDDLYYSNYIGYMTIKEQMKILDNFKNSKLGIITCVYCLGEGFDLPLLNGVVFAENMSSNIRIIQSVLRASRININEPNKINNIILPYISRNDDIFEDDGYNKIKEVIKQMSIEDENILTKIKVSNRSNGCYDGNKCNECNECNKGYECINNKLTEELLLKISKIIRPEISYNKAKKILSKLGLKSIDEYNEVTDIRLPKNPSEYFGNHFKGWVDYLSIGQIYYDYETCKLKISEYMKKYPYLNRELKLYNISVKLYNLDNMFPHPDLWLSYYKIHNLDEIIFKINIRKFNKKNE